MKKIKKYPFVKQEEFKDCGVSCLLMIIMYYGGYINLEKLRDLTKTNRDGTTAYDIVTTAKNIGFNSYGIKQDLESDSKLILPIIAHVIIDKSLYHFVVIYEVDYKKRYLVIADPALKIKKVSFEEFEKIYTKNFIAMYPIKPIIKEKRIDTLSFLKGVLKNNVCEMVYILSFTIITLFFTFMNLLIIKILLSHNKKNLLIFLFITIILKNIFGYIRDKKIINFNYKINLDLTNDTFLNILLLPYKYYRNRNTGEIVSRINDIENINSFIIIVISYITDIIIILVSIILLFLINKKITIILFLISLIYLILYNFLYKKIESILNIVKMKKASLNTFEVEHIQGFESIKGLNLEQKIYKNFLNKNKDYLFNLKTLDMLKTKVNYLKTVFYDLSILVILMMGIYLTLNQTIDMTDLLLIYSIHSYFIQVLENLLDYKLVMSEIKISIKRILELKNNGIKQKKKLVGNIEFRNVNYEYNDLKILNNVNLNINMKDKIMMIGKSGSGKSTILKLLNQYYKTSGIYIDENKLNNVNLKNQISYISQNEYLFTDTIYNNISFEEKNIDKIIEICELESVINKSELGLNMLIEENGFNLSGGEKQRIVLARALCRKFNYLFIDEGLSEVDINMERRIIKRLLKIYKDKTIIIVSHRLDNIDLFDKVIKVDKEIEVISKNEGGILC